MFFMAVNTNAQNCNDAGIVFPVNSVIVANSTTICSGNSVKLSISEPMPNASGITYEWLSSATLNGSYTTAATTTIPTYTSGTLTSGRCFKVSVKCNNTVVFTTPTVCVSMSVNEKPNVADSSRCGAGEVNMRAITASSTNKVFWFDSPTSAYPIGEGHNFTTPHLTANTPFYIAAGGNGLKTTTVGTATTATSTTEFGPFNNSNRSSNIQILYTGAEIISAGGNNGYKIDALDFYCNALPQYAFPNYKVSIKKVPSTMTSLVWQTGGFTEVTTINYFMPIVGWNTFNFKEPIYWNGTDNFVINICWDPINPTSNASGTHRYNSSPGKMLAYNSNVNPACGMAGSSASSNRPNIRIYQTTACIGAKDTAMAIITASPNAEILPTNPAPICNGDTLLLTTQATGLNTYQWFFNNNPIPGATQSTYKATQAGNYSVNISNVANGCIGSTSANYNLSVIPMPVPALTHQGAVDFCEGGSLVLKAEYQPTYAYQWYRNSNPIPGALDTIYNVTESGNYSVFMSSSNGCSQRSHSVPVTIYPNPIPHIIRNGDMLSTYTYKTYQWFRDNAVIPGANQQTYHVTNIGSYFVETTTDDDCINRSESYLMTSLNIQNAIKDLGIALSPNPTQNIVTIKSPIDVNVDVQNITGQKVGSFKNVRSVDMSKYIPGIYLFTITDRDGQYLGTEKIVKQD